MDNVLSGLVARYPRVTWGVSGNGWLGVCGPVRVFVEADDFGGSWARGWIRDTDRAVGCTAADPVQAVGKLAAHLDFADALHAAPVVPARVVEYIPPTEAELATAQEPQRVPFPAMIGGPVVASCLGLALVFALALVAGMGGMWWLTGGAL